jgi:hypothetical protein
MSRAHRGHYVFAVALGRHRFLSSRSTTPLKIRRRLREAHGHDIGLRSALMDSTISKLAAPCPLVDEHDRGDLVFFQVPPRLTGLYLYAVDGVHHEIAVSAT